MKLINIDVILSQRLSSIEPMNRVIEIERIKSEDGIEINLVNVVRIVRAFIVSKKLVERDDFNAQVALVIKEFMNKKEDEVDSPDLIKLFSVFEYYNYSLKIIGRLDLSAPEELDLNDKLSYLFYNYNNGVNYPGFYLGYGKSYDSKSKPLVMDYMDIFGLSQEDINTFDLNVAFKTYELFKSNDNLNDFDDRYPRSFIESRGMKFTIECFI